MKKNNWTKQKSDKHWNTLIKEIQSQPNWRKAYPIIERAIKQLLIACGNGYMVSGAKFDSLKFKWTGGK